jgi:hypothetical protein
MQQVAHPVSAISIRVYDAITYSLTHCAGYNLVMKTMMVVLTEASLFL